MCWCLRSLMHVFICPCLPAHILTHSQMLMCSVQLYSGRGSERSGQSQAKAAAFEPSRGHVVVDVTCMIKASDSLLVTRPS
ncbi:uncharacterized protein F5147DRAFT_717506 [Suillus discolor]|uniref:Secreted protein n=1 Tax=Suillus discolor TaxID=1912936 RepID=A0A9P7EX93_9AGAM|nr:uncharacterized protein F5147DRAFT_717506 [Suillus discolor]KAG2095894.1 hypothetical protein F5147DRAFT_717506 [Suillus discolor]